LEKLAETIKNLEYAKLQNRIDEIQTLLLEIKSQPATNFKKDLMNSCKAIQNSTPMH
jgi:hypothetical protein